MKTKPDSRLYFFKKFKTYSAEEILAAGGTEVFAKKIGHDPKKLHHLKGKPLSEKDFQKAIKMLTK